MNQPYVVLGATGGQGGAVVDALMGRRVPVRAVVRNPKSRGAVLLVERGVEIVVADLFDTAHLKVAMTGSAGVFALTTPFEEGPDAEVRQGHSLITAALLAKVPHLVLSSVANSDQHTGVPHFESKALVETALATSGLSYTIVGPTYFYDNILGGLDDVALGRLDLAVPVDKPLAQLSRRDLGRFVATVFDQPEAHAGARIDLASDAPTPNEMARGLSTALGRPVTAHCFDPDLIASPDMRAMFRFLNGHGYSVDIAALHRRYPDVHWQTFENFLVETF